jgi:hypothetical protein
VIVQEMVEATVSGIAFSDDPLSCGALQQILKAIEPNGGKQKLTKLVLSLILWQDTGISWSVVIATVRVCLA